MRSIQRREFLKSTLAASAIGVAPFNILKAGPSPNSKLNVACIGVGSQGSSNAEYLTRSNNVIALCDVDEAWHKKHIQKRTSLHGTKLWTDYRMMFDKIGDQIDAVCVATPEHNHYTISTYAIRRGKHVYCQKPLCHDIAEVRALTREAASRPGQVTQMGIQIQSAPVYRRAVTIIQEGLIGKVEAVHSWCGKGWPSSVRFGWASPERSISRCSTAWPKATRS